MTTWIILGVFFAIIIILIVVATIGARKDKVEKMIANDKREKEMSVAQTSRIIIYTSLDKIIKELEKELKDFKPSIGIKTLGEINNQISSKLKKMNNSKELKEVYSFEDYKLEMKPIVDELNKNKPSSWDKEATFAMNLVKVKFDAIKKNEKNKELISQGEKKEWN